MSSNYLIALASLLTGLGATAAAVVAAYALRSQQRVQQRQNDLENLRFLTSQYAGLLPMRRRAAQAFLAGKPDEHALREILNFLETSGYMVREGFISVRAFSETLGQVPVAGWWYASLDLITSARERVSPHVFEHFEWLKDQIGEVWGSQPDEAWVADFIRREAALSILSADDGEATGT